MSIKCESNSGWVLDHSAHITNIYSNVNIKGLDFVNDKPNSAIYSFNSSLFKIITPYCHGAEAINFSKPKCLKRKRPSLDKCSPIFGESSEVHTVQTALEELVALGRKSGHFSQIPNQDDFKNNNGEARKYSTWFFSEICSELLKKCNGGNLAESPIIVNIYGQDFLLPNSCKFFCCDVKDLDSKLPGFSQFHFILLDPPWWNKYIRRRKSKQESAGYKMMYNDEICALPIHSWLAPEGLVAVWCTNSPGHFRDIIFKWFPKWCLQYAATWYWVKVTQSGQPVCQFSAPPGKQPYEKIVFGVPKGRKTPPPPDQRCLVSVPSAIHSHKPPLSDVMKLYLPDQSSCLELFARYLLPHWTSVGDQVLSLQNLKLYSQNKNYDNY